MISSLYQKAFSPYAFLLGICSTRISLSLRLRNYPVLIPMIGLVAVGLIYGFAVIAESPVYSSGLSELVSPDFLGTALVLRSLIGFGVGAVAPTAFGLMLDLTNSGGTQRAFGYLPQWGWAFSMLGLVALIGPWAMWKLRSMPENMKMAGGKK